MRRSELRQMINEEMSLLTEQGGGAHPISKALVEDLNIWPLKVGFIVWTENDRAMVVTATLMARVKSSNTWSTLENTTNIMQKALLSLRVSGNNLNIPSIGDLPSRKASTKKNATTVDKRAFLKKMQSFGATKKSDGIPSFEVQVGSENDLIKFYAALSSR